MESMQSVLPSSVSPGWNDPPNLGCSAPNTPSARLTHLRKRLVDPSISVIFSISYCTSNSALYYLQLPAHVE
ncbi:unnamed protein product [Heligmosomoides polygyrus]|uniref:Uncharacterized protein n=1 Tax=Heligmosomoides polygyrus TaxID=6339 RepID=A0A183FJQ9_HELPZ|nr:unnamed protein product [Heligmosomoides polygyrus]